ncbi:MAG TPA: T9SS type A sorting domain-containing protein [Flavobacterium sp.]|jgi:hypothetical protein
MRTFLLLQLLFFSIAGHSQMKLKFEYDLAGNQTKRHIVFESRDAAVNDSIYKSPEEITEEDLESLIGTGISFYPNPVKQDLYIKWTQLETPVNAVEIYSMSGQLLRRIPNLKNDDNVVLSFQDLPQAIYNVVLFFNNSETQTLKIVKQ